MKTTNPFPGMNPFLQARWSDVHATLIVSIREALSEHLPIDLTIRAEEDVHIEDAGLPQHYRADVAIVEAPSRWSSAASEESTRSSIAIAEPELVEVNSVRRWLEIRDTAGSLVTVIEVISPSNKSGLGLLRYLQRQRDLLAAGVNLVEIDLLRGGMPAMEPEFVNSIRICQSTRFLIVATRALRPNLKEVYYCPLKERLPVVGVPLRAQDSDAPLDIQPLIDRCYMTGRYWKDSQGPIPDPPLMPDEHSWAENILREAELRK